MSLHKFLTTTQPLGPIRHEKIILEGEEKLLRDGPNNLLLYPSDTFESNLESPFPVILGRRGSGKTAFVSALLNQANGNSYYQLDSNNGRQAANGEETKDITILVTAMDHLDDMIYSVSLDCHFWLNGGEWVELPAETSGKFWERRIWELVFQHIYKLGNLDDTKIEYRKLLPEVFKYIEKDDIIDPQRRITDQALNQVFENTKNAVVSYLSKNDRQCYIVFDSFDEYPIQKPRSEKIFAGLLRCLTTMHDKYENVKFHCCLPEELKSFIYEHSANESRDLSSVSLLRWKPSDLLKIFAERYRDFLKLHCDDVEFLAKIVKYDFNYREQLRLFLNQILPENITNRWGVSEQTLAYLVRHSQLLPREFLLILGNAILRSKKEFGTWNYIDGKSIVEAIAECESEMANNVLKPFKYSHENLLDEAKEILPSLSPICTLSELNKHDNRFSKGVKQTGSPWLQLFEIGVLGYVDDDNSSDVYTFGKFHFNTKNPITFANHITYCVHPLFSGTWNLNRINGQKFIYPANVGIPK